MSTPTNDPERFLDQTPARLNGWGLIGQLARTSQTLMLMASVTINVIVIVAVLLSRSRSEQHVQPVFAARAPVEVDTHVAAAVDAGPPIQPPIEELAGTPTKIVLMATAATDASPPPPDISPTSDTIVISEMPVAEFPSELNEVEGSEVDEKVLPGANDIESASVGLRIDDHPNAPVVASTLAAAGTPFGVAKIELQLAPDMPWHFRADIPLRLTTNTGKALHAAYQYNPPRQASKYRPAIPAQLVCWFLFDHIAPTTVTLRSADFVVAADVPLKMEPAEVATARATLLAEWWQQYSRFDLPHS